MKFWLWKFPMTGFEATISKLLVCNSNVDCRVRENSLVSMQNINIFLTINKKWNVVQVIQYCSASDSVLHYQFEELYFISELISIWCSNYTNRTHLCANNPFRLNNIYLILQLDFLISWFDYDLLQLLIISPTHTATSKYQDFGTEISNSRFSTCKYIFLYSWSWKCSKSLCPPIQTCSTNQ